MKLPLSQAAATTLRQVIETGSTNDDLARIAAQEPEFSVLVTGSQTAGRGRLGREWVAPAGSSIAISVLLRPVVTPAEPLGIEHFGWLPLIAGAAMATAVAPLVPGTVGLKWPNDVQIDGMKVSGLLAELSAAGDAVILGAGVNLALSAEQLPTPTSTSLELAGAILHGDELADALLSGYLVALRRYYGAFLESRGDAVSSGTMGLVSELCTTIGSRVRVQLPSGNDLIGTATAMDASGRLLVQPDSEGQPTAVAAGDVTHLRYE